MKAWSMSRVEFSILGCSASLLTLHPTIVDVLHWRTCSTCRRGQRGQSTSKVSAALRPVGDGWWPPALSVGRGRGRPLGRVSPSVAAPLPILTGALAPLPPCAQDVQGFQ